MAQLLLMEIVMNLLACLKTAALKQLSVDQKLVQVQVNVLHKQYAGQKLMVKQ